MLDAGIKAFRVLTHDHQIETGIAAGNVRESPYGTQIRVKIERFAQAHVDGSETLANRRGDRTFQANLISLDRFDKFIR